MTCIVDTMTYDATAQKLAVKVIGTVESNLNYGSVNYNDPITVGVAQWYGTRAAGILVRMRTDNPDAWYGVEASIASQLASVADSNAYWNTRYLTFAEGQSLVGVLQRNQAIQNLQLTDDLDAYVTVAMAHGLDPDVDTAVMIYFFSLYHQGGTTAFDVVDALDSTPTLAEIHALALAHGVFGKYGARYNTTYDLIDQADLTGVDPAAPPAPIPVNGNARIIQRQGDLLIAQFQNGERVLFYPDGRERWMAGKAKDPATPVQPGPPADNGDWVLPLTGSPTMTSGYGPRNAPPGTMGASFHWGADFANPGGSPGNVVAPTGMVITVAFENGAPGGNATAGTYVKARTVDNAYTFNFYHMQAGSLAVSVGDTVAVGDVLGIEGATGNVTGQHLHFEAYEGTPSDPWPPPYGNPVDPLPILRAHGVTV